jgi:hypothetical protein
MTYESAMRDLLTLLHAARRVACYRAMLRDFANEFGAALNPPRALECDYRESLDLLERVVDRVGARVSA